jgi:hypothetical protein
VQFCSHPDRTRHYEGNTNRLLTKYPFIAGSLALLRPKGGGCFFDAFSTRLLCKNASFTLGTNLALTILVSVLATFQLLREMRRIY